MGEEKQDFLRRWSRLKRESAAQKPAAPENPPQLPPLDSLTFESDFKAFMHSKVEEGVKRAALNKLFSDPRFNVMDGLDTYIDDYTKADPISADMLEQLVQTRYIFDPPKTEITAEGHVIDSPIDHDSREKPEAVAAPDDPASPHPADGATTTVAPDSGKR